MFDHIMLRTQQFDVMTAFYEKALAPLGIKKLMAFESAAGFGRDAPGLWISKSSEPRSSVHLALSSPDQSAVRAFYAAALAAGGKTMALRDRATSPRIITPPSSSTPTATTSKRRLAAPERRRSRPASLRDRLRRSSAGRAVQGRKLNRRQALRLASRRRHDGRAAMSQRAEALARDEDARRGRSGDPQRDRLRRPGALRVKSGNEASPPAAPRDRARSPPPRPRRRPGDSGTRSPRSRRLRHERPHEARLHEIGARRVAVERFGVEAVRAARQDRLRQGRAPGSRDANP